MDQTAVQNGVSYTISVSSDAKNQEMLREAEKKYLLSCFQVIF